MSKPVNLNVPVLTLNVNYEPLHVCNVKRALSLLFAGKAEMVVNGRGTIHTTAAEYDLPSVIKLVYMVKRPRPIIALSKREILRRDNYTCQYCGRKTHTLTLDHVIPRHTGGEHSWENLVAACASCNRHKGSKTVEQANMRLLSRPAAPSATAVYRFSNHLDMYQEWAPFVVGW